MEDLTYILSLGFSNADLPRALILSFFLAMIFGGTRTIWTLGVFALVLDRVFWPLIEQAASGADAATVFTSFGAMLGAIVDDLGVYVVRYMGLVIMIGLFIEGRKRIHQLAPAKKAHA